MSRGMKGMKAGMGSGSMAGGTGGYMGKGGGMKMSAGMGEGGMKMSGRAGTKSKVVKPMKMPGAMKGSRGRMT